MANENIGLGMGQPENVPAIALEVSVPDEVYAKRSEAWAVGKINGVDVPTTDPTYHNNSKYYAEQSADAAEEAANEAIEALTVSATELEAGATPTATKSTVSGHEHIEFGIPKGQKGDKGDPGSIDNAFAVNIEMSPTDSTTISQAISGKVDNNQGAGNAGKALGIDDTGAVVPVPFSGDDFTGATASNDGVHGYVPAPLAGDQGKFLKGDGTWGEVADPDVFTGATASTNGTTGLVPAPSAGDQSKVLTGDGTWAVSPGAKVYAKTVTVTNTSGSYTQTFTDENITADMKAVELEVSHDYVFGDLITVTPANGSFTVSCNSVTGTDTITISFIKVIADPTAITSTEFDVLSNRIGSLSSLTTTDKTNVVSAVNEVNARVADAEDDIADNATAISNYTQMDGTLTYITSGDVRNINTSGRYYIGGGVSNLPNASAHYVDVYVYSTAEGGYKHLVACRQNSGQIFTCKCTAGVWTDWEELSVIKKVTKTFTKMDAGKFSIATSEINGEPIACKTSGGWICSTPSTYNSTYRIIVYDISSGSFQFNTASTVSVDVYYI